MITEQEKAEAVAFAEQETKEHDRVLRDFTLPTAARIAELEKALQESEWKHAETAAYYAGLESKIAKVRESLHKAWLDAFSKPHDPNLYANRYEIFRAAIDAVMKEIE